MLKGMWKKFWGRFNMGACGFSHLDWGGGGCTKFPTFKGREKFYPALGGGGGAQEVSEPSSFSHFVAPPPIPCN